MAKSSGLGDRLAVGGYDLSGDTGSVETIRGGPALLDITAISKSAVERIGGLRDGEISFSAFFNDATGQEHPVLKGLPSTDVIACYGKGAVLGNAAAFLTAKQMNYDGTLPQGGPWTWKTQALANGKGLFWGQQYTAWFATHASATNGTAIDYGSVSTAFGMSAMVMCASLGSGTVTPKMQDSADNSTFADIITFTNITSAPAAEIAETTATATVRRYTRFASTNTFTNASLLVVAVRHSVETIT